MRTGVGRKPDCWSESFWKSVVWPEMRVPISAEVILDNLIKNNVDLILVGGYASVYHGLSENKDRKDYDFIISSEEKNLNLIFDILSENYNINKKVFLSNVLNYLKLKTTSKKIDFIKKLIGCPLTTKKINTSIRENKGPRKNMKIYYSLKEFNYSTLIASSKKIDLNGNIVSVMGLQDYIDSQYIKNFIEQ